MHRAVFLLVLISLSFSSCDDPPNEFTIEDEKKLCSVLHNRILERTADFQVLPSSNIIVYDYMQELFDEVLNAPSIVFKDYFNWTIYILVDDSKIDAFSLPGGCIYIYTGLLKNMDKVDHLAGMIAHIVYHVDKRHQISNVYPIYGFDKLNAIANETSSSEDADQLLDGLVDQRYTENQESDADQTSVDYLQFSRYSCSSLIGFYQLMDSLPTNSFLINHPLADREQVITDRVQQIGCSSILWHDSPNGDQGNYSTVISTLP